MADKPTDSPDSSLTKPTPEGEQQESPGQEEASVPASRQVIEEQFEQVIAGTIGPARNPVLEKLTEDHITTLIENDGRNDERSFEYSKADRRYRLVYVLIVLLSFGLLTFYLAPADKELYKQIVQVLAAFAGGFGAGYGVRHWRG